MCCITSFFDPTHFPRPVHSLHATLQGRTPRLAPTPLLKPSSTAISCTETTPRRRSGHEVDTQPLCDDAHGHVHIDDDNHAHWGNSDAQRRRVGANWRNALKMMKGECSYSWFKLAVLTLTPVLIPIVLPSSRLSSSRHLSCSSSKGATVTAATTTTHAQRKAPTRRTAYDDEHVRHASRIWASPQALIAASPHIIPKHPTPVDATFVLAHSSNPRRTD